MMNEHGIKTGAKKLGIGFILFLLLGLTATPSWTEERNIEIKGKTGEMTITMKFAEPVSYRSFILDNPPRLVLDISGITLKEPQIIEVKNEVVKTIDCFQYQPDTGRIVVNLTQAAESRVRKVGSKLLLHLSLPQEVKTRLLAEKEARARVEEEAKRGLAAEERERVKREKEEAKRLALARKAERRAREAEERRLEAERKAREREEEARKRAEEKAKRLLHQRIRKETKLQAKKVESERKSAEEIARREAKKTGGKIEERFRRGEKHYQANQFDEAIREFEMVLDLDPANEEAQNYLFLAQGGKEAQLLAEKEEREKERREQERKRQEEEKEKNIVAYLKQGRKYFLQGRYEEAISEGERARALSPGNRQAERLIMQANRKSLEMEEKKAQAEREMVERRRTLDVTKAVYVSPIDYAQDINPEEKAESDRREDKPGEKPDGKKKDSKLKVIAEETLVSMNFKDTDLSEVILYLSKLSKVTIALDERALDELEDPNVTIYIPEERPLSLTEALNMVLGVKGLNYVFKENYIRVTRRGLEAGEEPVTKTYKLKYGIRRIRPVTLTLPGGG